MKIFGPSTKMIAHNESTLLMTEWNEWLKREISIRQFKLCNTNEYINELVSSQLK